MTPDDFKRIATEIAERKAYTSEFAAAIEQAMVRAYQAGYCTAFGDSVHGRLASEAIAAPAPSLDGLMSRSIRQQIEGYVPSNETHLPFPADDE